MQAVRSRNTARVLELCGVPFRKLLAEKLTGSKVPVKSQKHSPVAAALQAQTAEVQRLWDSGESTLAWLELIRLSVCANARLLHIPVSDTVLYVLPWVLHWVRAS